MHILVFSLGAVFKNAVQGGSQKVLRDLSKGLAKRGHCITIICPRREDNNEPFEMDENVMVKPILPLGEAFPMPYAVSPFRLSETCRIIEAELSKADILYCHDGGLNIEFLKNKIPTVISLRDFYYPETLLGALNFREDAIIVNSMHSYLCLKDSFASVNPLIEGKISLIYNGYDADHFREKDVSSIFLDTYGLPPKNDEIVIGFPHRPEISKGFIDAINVLHILKQKTQKRVKLLVPQYMDKGLSERTDSTYEQVKLLVEKLQLSDSVIYHPWVCHEMMPEYYSYCDVILCIGNFVESFSNVSVEALLCGTPVVAANTSTYRTMPIRKYLKIVPYGDVVKASQAVYDALFYTSHDCCIEARKMISSHLTITKMIDEYEAVFNSALVGNKECESRENSKRCNNLKGEDCRYKLTAWCNAEDGKIYDDYKGTYVPDPLKGAFSDPNDCFSLRELLEEGMVLDDINQAISDGILIQCR